MTKERLEEERLQRPFDADKRTTIGIYTTKGVQRKLTEIAAARNKALGTFLREIIEGIANGYGSVMGEQLCEIELENVSAENTKLRNRINELEKANADAQSEIGFYKERISDLEAPHNAPAQLLALAESDPDDLEERMFFAVYAVETMWPNQSVDAIKTLFRVLQLADKYEKYKEARQ